MTTAVAAPFRFFSLQVVRTERLGPSLVRVSFAGDDLRFFLSDGKDQSLSLFLPHPGQEAPAVPYELGDGWWQAWRELPDDVRAVMRSYTLRGLRSDAHGDTVEIDIDFVLHGVEPGAAVPAGPASRWASEAATGHRVVLLGPAIADNRAIRFRPPADTDLVLIWGDDTALPAASAILESLPAGTPARVWLEVHHAGDIQDLATEADAEITWLVRSEGAPAALDTVRAARFPAGQSTYAWIAGESGRVKELRRHLVRERGIDKRRVTFVGYWREGLTEEQLRERGA
ncbi:siderophore-interacting protein [Streptomyces stelliscabiei]|uniref:NADPH-dependent ferric siderophore reductase n=1 Tax=Streptomyces stelliscabiei TaxID=146820 RepID=A0A8I0P7B8_9ACTN|nr:siderophore-interacting protein [Streptomyces stelliscabiei]KND45638.1 sialic acid transporter [Streptomyces stelliscabiei]MBE1597509.1 NADPH-dependent ferric siderophore reductase [Streptomyces stelliscabiei]MDX2513566.1 siderophore-interacting protein [Streptomyces stelliscabiei]MDX2549839.1 siderophore-interacting protein [Streptomyces stelliscabiei]MDX2610740.1 siderophore-interacting protein [Streptomyces stelliscabiei]